MTPTTAAAMPVRAPLNGLLSCNRSMNGAPRPIHRKHGTKVHRREQTAERPGEHRRQNPGVAVGGEEADELHSMISGPGGGLGHAEPVEHLAGLERLLA
jgi:hypothetical protein